MFKFVHIADLHMGQRFESASFGNVFGRIKRNAIKENLRKVIEYCNAHEVDFLIMAGDCLESDYVQTNDLLDLNYMFKNLKATKVIMIAGNHDPIMMMQNKTAVIQWPDYVYQVKSPYEYIEFKDKDVGFICSSWQHKSDYTFDYKQLETLTQESDMTYTIGVFHGDVYSNQGYLCLDQDKLLKSKLDYIALGHIHKADIFSNKMAYPGSLEPLDFSEKGQHGFVMGVIDEKGLNMNHIPHMIHPMRVQNLEISEEESAMEILDKIKALLEKFEANAMVRLILRGEMEIPFIDIEEMMQGDWMRLAKPYVSYLEVLDQTSQPLDIENIYDEHQNDILGYYIRELQTRGLKDSDHQEALELGVKMILDAMQ